MAQTGYTPISIYYSSTAGNTPTAGNLVAGELAINTADGKLFYKDSAGVVQVIAGKGGAGVAGGSNTQVQYNSSGSLAGSANFTFNGTTVTIANDASISGLTVGKGGGTLVSNTIVGNSAFGSNTAGQQNTGLGYQALYSVSNADSNTAIGNQVMRSNTTGSNNTSVGNQALYSNTTASNNTAVGYQSLYTNTTGNQIVAIGKGAGYSNTTGTDSVFVGYHAGYSNTGAGHVAVGSTALTSNSTGIFNTAVGYEALPNNTTGSYNTAHGMQSLRSNTTASNNTAVGYQAGYSLTTGGSNTVMGYQAFDAATTASGSTIVGNRAGGAITTGLYNTIIGADAGASLTTGNGNCFIGATGTYASGEVITTGSKNTIIGSYNGNLGGLDIRTASNNIVLSDGDGNPRLYIKNSNTTTVNSTSGDSEIDFASGGTIKTSMFWYSTNSNFYVQNTSAGVYLAPNGTSWVANSDLRLKNITSTFTNALENVAQLEAVKFTWKSDESNKPCVGLIAQSVEKVLPEAVTKNVIPKSDDSTEYLGVSYTDVIPLLVAAIQELNAKVTALEAQLQGK